MQRDIKPILKRLLSVTGPIDTFYIRKGFAGYGILKFTGANRITNASLLQIKATPSLEADMIAAARRAGRIRWDYLGQPDNAQAVGALLLTIARSSKLRSKHWQAVKKALGSYRKYWAEAKVSLPDPRAPDYLGWRVWHWCPENQKLVSPAQGTVWHTPELRVSDWSQNDAVRNHRGIHAARMPYDWKKAKLEGTELAVFSYGSRTVIGVVERYGRYVLGTQGWRAEWVIIKALKAPSTEIGLQLETAYPDVEVIYDDNKLE
jgi:hypothetical protein